MRYKHHAIQEQRKQKMLHNHFLAMMVRYNKKILDRKLGQTLKEKQEFALRVKLFIKWLRKFRHLKECD